MRRDNVPAHTYVDSVVRKLDFERDHPEWNLRCQHYRWIAENGDQRLESDDLGMLIDRLEILV
jgi:hypothetical protein